MWVAAPAIKGFASKPMPQLIGRGAPAVEDNALFFLDVSGVDSGDRPAALRRAGAAIDAVLPGGGGVSVCTYHAAPLGRAQRVQLAIGPGGDAASALERYAAAHGHAVRVPQPDSSGEWVMPIHTQRHPPLGAIEIIFILGFLPGPMRRAGLGAFLLDQMGCSARVLAEFHPADPRVGSGDTAQQHLFGKLAVWVELPADAPPLPAVIHLVGCGACDAIRVFPPQQWCPPALAAAGPAAPPAGQPLRAGATHSELEQEQEQEQEQQKERRRRPTPRTRGSNRPTPAPCPPAPPARRRRRARP